jgi:hypothetical protein
MTSHDFAPILSRSCASAAFREALSAYEARQPADRIQAAVGCPRVKVLRAVAQLLHSEPGLAVERVHVTAVSGCADFIGTLVATDSSGEMHSFAFAWDCEWKARQLGYTDGFGFPDQIRAAQEFGWQCFSRWDRIAVAAAQLT